LLAACVLGLLLCPFVYLAIGALRAFEPAMFVITLPPLFASVWYLGQRYLRRAVNEPLRIRSVLFEAASWLVIGFFLVVVSDLNLMTPLERAGLFFCIHPVASAVLAPFTALRPTALKQRLIRLPPWMALTALAVYAGLAAGMAASYMLLPQRFIGS
jgi:hypothetical protein